MDRSDPTYVDAIRYLYERINYEKSTDRPYNRQTYRLGRMSFLLEKLGNPHLAAPAIHIAGTKGKGSVAWLIAETLRRSGYRTGLYTSPHLQFLEERFVIDGQMPPLEEVYEQIQRLKVAATEAEQSEHGSPTFFEMTTALAWCLFQSHATEANVIEVGLGGRLDSTNVCQSALSIITSISFDHQQQLGNTLALIAAEKGGIIKPNTPVIHGVRAEEPRQIIRNIAAEYDCELWELGTDFDCSVEVQRASVSQPPNGSRPQSQLQFLPLNLSLPLKGLEKVSLAMPGRHQAENAAVAIAAWNRLQKDGWRIPESALRAAMAETRLPSRIEEVMTNPSVLVDAAHNVASINALLATIEDHYAPKRLTFIFACSKDKEYEAMLKSLLTRADRIILTQFHSNPRAVLTEKLETLARTELDAGLSTCQLFSAPNAQLALKYAIQTGASDELICVAGSFFLAAEAKEALAKR